MLASAGLALAVPIRAAAPPPPAPDVTYADLVTLADSAPLVLRAELRKVAPLDPRRAGAVRPGWARLYVEAQALEILAGEAPAGVMPVGPKGKPGLALRYLADVPLDAGGKLPGLTRLPVLLLARSVPGNAGELQLLAPDTQWVWSAALEARLRAVIAQVRAPGAPAVVTGVREALFVPGTLAGAGETQIFLATADGSAASLSVVHQPGGATGWSASFSEVLDPTGAPPPRETLAWYRLACGLPRALPAGSNVSESGTDRARAVADYARVLADLGRCERKR